MRRLVVSVAAASLLMISATACSGEEAATGNDGSPAANAAQTTQSKPSAGEISAKDFDRSLFDENSATLTNEWVAFTVGKRFVWNGWTEEDGERIPRRIVFTVTDMTKEIDGVRVMVGWDRDYRAGKLLETELLFLAQDKSGNVWHLGEYAELWSEDGQFEGGQAWMVGHLKGAKAGIYMRANAKSPAPAYSQGFAPAPYFWNDWGKLNKVAAKTCGPKRCWKDVVVIDEYEPGKPGAYQVKYYARGIGNVRVGWRGSDADHEVLYLDKVVRLGPKEMAKARAAVRAHEQRAYVYGSTPPAKPRAG